MNSEHYMHIAYKLALKGKGTTSPNPMVGAVIVKNNKIIAQGFHARCGGDHAEIVALKKAGEKARGATLYVTLEPCAHHGRTPPCVNRIIDSGIAKVVIGMKDPNPLMNGKSVVILKKFGIKVEVGCLEDELTRMNEVFIKYIKERMPFVTTKTAQTLDGKIATSSGDSKWITSESTRAYARSMRDQFDAIMVGANTVKSDDPGLNPFHKGKRLKKIIVDSTLALSSKARLFQGADPSDIIIATTAKAARSKMETFSKMGSLVLVAPAKGKHGHVDLKWLMKELAKLEISSVLIEGGGRLIGRAIKDGLVDRMMIYIAPKIFGDQNGVSSIAGLNVVDVNKAVSLKDVTVKFLKPDILIEGYVHRNR